MSEKYNNVITVLETLDKDVTLKFIKARLLDAELKMNGERKRIEDAVFNVTNQKKCYNRHELRHFAVDSYKKNQNLQHHR